MTFHGLMTCASDATQSSLGRSGVGDWVQVAGYLLCAVLAWVVIRRQGRAAGRSFWWFLLLLTLLFALIAAFNLGTTASVMLRCQAQAVGWYQDRRAVQESLIGALFLIVAMMGLTMLVAMRRHLQGNGLALLGVTVVVGFVAIRAISLHWIDALIGQRIGGVRIGFLIENLGLLMIAANAVVHILRPKRRRRRKSLSALT